MSNVDFPLSEVSLIASVNALSSEDVGGSEPTRVILVLPFVMNVVGFDDGMSLRGDRVVFLPPFPFCITFLGTTEVIVTIPF